MKQTLNWNWMRRDHWRGSSPFGWPGISGCDKIMSPNLEPPSDSFSIYSSFDALGLQLSLIASFLEIKRKGQFAILIGNKDKKEFGQFFRPWTIREDGVERVLRRKDAFVQRGNLTSNIYSELVCLHDKELVYTRGDEPMHVRQFFWHTKNLYLIIVTQIFKNLLQ